MKSNMENVQDLLERLEKKRREYNPSKETINKEEHFIEDIKFNSGDGWFEIITDGNIREKCEITQNEAKRGCIKNISYTKLNRFHKEIKTNIDIEIPNNIKNGQDIIIKEKGNYMVGKYSDLIVKIIIR